jgi:glycine/D-amino acid oxidase-like deaminating enzyme
MKVDTLIIGQGISGTFLSYYLLQQQQTVLVIDNNLPDSPSRIAAGVINPVTGRRLVTVWMVDELHPFAEAAYKEIGDTLGINAITERSIIDFFPNPFMREGFMKKMQEDDSYVREFSGDESFSDHFNYDFGFGEIAPAYTAQLESLLPAWRKKLLNDENLLETNFDLGELKLSGEKVFFKDIEASRIIFCDGAASANNPWFNALPFAPNKGEALVVEIEGLPSNHIYKKGMMLVPMEQPNIFWIGSAYTWDFDNTDPTPEFLELATATLREWVKYPFKVLEHRAGLRPATLERRPFVGLHPSDPRIGILNGMGTKGCSLAPYFAKQLADHIIEGASINKDAGIERFRKILTRQTGG